MSMRIGINGFGRIGRLFLQAACDRGLLGNEIDVVGIVEKTTDANYLAYQIKYDSVHGKFNHLVSVARSNGPDENPDVLVIEGHGIRCVQASNDPVKLPWEALGVGLVVESTGKYVDEEKASRHLLAGAKKVVITSPAKGDVKTIVMGVNEREYDDVKHNIISSASCTANCLSPLIHVLMKEGIGINHALVTAINSYTASRNIVDGYSGNDWRSGRCAAMNIIPSFTSAVKSARDIFPQLKDRISGVSFRVPTPDVSVVDLTFNSSRNTSIEEVDTLMKKASESYLKGILGYTREEFVSTDFIHNDHSSVFDSSVTLRNNLANEKRLFKIISWYDNEWGYANRVVDLVLHVIRSSVSNNQEELSHSVKRQVQLSVK